MYTDIVLVVGSKAFPAHRFILAASSVAFHRLLTMDLSIYCSNELGARSSSESSMVIMIQILRNFVIKSLHTM